ncbi:nucleotidyltransferase domain-containing protein [Mycolicibacter longobardus]|uniref:[protein-PII] uridylyltransferase family protein n=1 Tax=Mycolicibacter longobardus TaxID=1108812 RepID=UPI002AF3C323|nr:nucleotidyltransferase domain-containing protein [Mycolicibacter longobardus]
MFCDADPVSRSNPTDCTAIGLARARAELRCRTPDQLSSAALREAWRRLHETWLAAKAAEIGIATASGFAIVATGSLARYEMLPYSDLDLLLLHDDMPAETVEKVAELLWYPLWDVNARLDHSVRTVAEALKVADADIFVDLGLLDARHIVGDERLSVRLLDGVRNQWRHGIRSRYDELVESTQSRWRRCGDIADRVEPDVKSGHGGLRDVQLLDALSAADLADSFTARGPGHGRGSVRGARRTLLDVRTEIHRTSGRENDVLRAQDADEISIALRFGGSFDLIRRVSDAANTISDRVDAALRAAADALRRCGMSAMRV